MIYNRRFYLLLGLLLPVATHLSAQTLRHTHTHHRQEQNIRSAERVIAADSAVQPRYNGAHLTFAVSKFDFGEVPRKGGDLTVRFEYVNDGTEPLVITRIATSCTCIRTHYRRRPLDVGERDAIELTYEPHKMEAGVFHKVVQVYSNSVDGMHLLTVSGNSVESNR